MRGHSLGDDQLTWAGLPTGVSRIVLPFDHSAVWVKLLREVLRPLAAWQSFGSTSASGRHC